MYPFRGLPRELVDEIMDYVDANSDVSTLSALSRSCKVFLPRCQRRIFSTIRFKCADYRLQYNLGPNDPLEAKIEDFLGILQCSPRIAGYVRRLELSITTQYNYWVTEEPFIKIMETISRQGNFIKELGLYAISFPEQFHDLRALEQKFLQPFVNPFITSLTVSGLVSIPISLLAESVNLQDFTIDHSALEHLAYDVSAGMIPAHAYPKLQTLTFNPSMGVLETILKAGTDPNRSQILDLSRLRVIHTRLYPHNVQAINDIVQITRDSLEELHMRHNTDLKYSPFDASIDFSEAIGLRIIDIDVVFPSYSSGLGDPLADLCSILNTIPNNNSIAEFKLCAYIGFYSRKDGPESSFSADWAVLDSELVRISSEKPLVLHLHMIYSYDEESVSSSDEDEGETEPENKHRVIENLCKETFQKLAQASFPLVHGSEHIVLKLSQSLEMD